MAIFILALIPLWLVYGYGLRKSYMLRKIRHYVRKHPQEASPSENADAPGSNRKLPRDIVFDEENDERTDSAQADRYPDLPAAGASAEWDEDGRDYRF